MSEILNKRLRAVILPPGQGKSYMSNLGLPPHIRDMDAVINSRGTEELRGLYREARSSGNWELYNLTLGYQIRCRLSDGDIIMVAHEELAKSIGAKIIGVYVTNRTLWEENVKARSRDPSEHLCCYLDAIHLADARGYTIYDTREDLYRSLKRCFILPH